MKKIDKDGLILCSIQGNIFESSLELTDSSSEVFIRRFMTSEIVKEFDTTAVLNDSLTAQDTFSALEKEFGKTSYGTVKYPKEVLFWVGYLYRYMAYTYEFSSKYIYKLLKPKELKAVYYPYHTMDCSAAIERILESKDITFDEKKQNERLLMLLRKRKYEKDIRLERKTKNFIDEPYLADNLNNVLNFSINYKESNIGCISISANQSIEIKIENSQYENDEIRTVITNKAKEIISSI